MPKKRQIKIDPEQAKHFWSRPVQETSAPQLSIIEPEIKKSEPKKEEPKYQREAIPPELALEQFAQSVCFAECLFKSYDQDGLLLELHPHRRSSGWFWECRKEPEPNLPYQTIILELPKISDDLYEEIWEKYYTEEYSLIRVYVGIGNDYKKSPLFEPYREMLRRQLQGYVVEQSA